MDVQHINVDKYNADWDQGNPLSELKFTIYADESGKRCFEVHNYAWFSNIRDHEL